MDSKIIFPLRLLELRKEKAISQKALAAEFSISDAAITMMEKGKRYPSFELLIALADYFEVSLDYLVGRSDTPYMLKNEDVETLSPEELEFVRKRREANR